MKKYKSSLFLFHRDLRLEDNTGLIEAMKNSEVVILGFIFDPRQVEDHPYKSNHALQFMLESLENLQEEIEKSGGKLHFFYGNPNEVLGELFRCGKLQAIFCNRDYTPFSIEREKNIEDLCRKNEVHFHQYSDLLICEPEQVKNRSGHSYKVFSAFYKRASLLSVRRPEGFREWKFACLDFPSCLDWKGVCEKMALKANPKIFARGSRAKALQILENLTRFDKL